MKKIVFEEIDLDEEKEVFIDLEDQDYGYFVSVEGEYLSVFSDEGKEIKLVYAEPSHAIEDLLKIFDIAAEVEYK